MVQGSAFYDLNDIIYIGDTSSFSVHQTRKINKNTSLHMQSSRLIFHAH